MMRVAIFGARGFLGRHICRFLTSRNIQLIEADVRPSSDEAAVSGVLSVVFDVVKATDYSEIVSEVDAIIYLVSTTLPNISNRAPILDVETNLLPLIRLLEAVKHTKKRLIFSSSGGTVYGPTSETVISELHSTNPICSYGIVKLASEKYLRLYRELYGFKSLSLRIANPYGIGQDLAKPQGTVGIFTQKILCAQKLVIWGDGETVRDYVAASDVAEAFWRALEYEGGISEMNIGSGVGTSLNELVRHIAEKCGHAPIIEYEEARTFDVRRNVLDNNLASKEIGWFPKTSLEAGLSDVVAQTRECALR